MWADGGCAASSSWAKGRLQPTLETVKRSDDVTGFAVLPRRWVVERTLSRISQRRRCVRDHERLPAHHEAMALWSMTILMRRRHVRANARTARK